MATEILEVQIKVDTGDVEKGFISLTRSAKNAGDAAGSSLGGGFSKGETSLIAINQGIELLKTGIAAVKEVADKVFEFAEAGEQIDAISKRFDILGEQFGLIPEDIKAGIESAVGGTVAMSDALETASKSFVELGANAYKLPEVFELARKAAQLFGGETTDRVEQLSRAIETGATRQLRSIGININASKVYAEYARSIGVTSSFLSEQQKQQAMLNAVLEKGGEQFKNVNGSLTPLAENSKKLTVAGKELGETLAKAFDNAFGSVIKSKIESTTSSLEVLNIKLGELLLGKVPTGAENVKVLTAQINDLIKSQDLASVHGDIGRVDELGKEIAALQQKLLIQKEIDNQQKTTAAQPSIAGAEAARAAANKRTFEQEEELRKLTLSAEQALSGDIKAVFDARKADHDTFYSSEKNVEDQYDILRTAATLKFQSETQAIREQYRNLDAAGQDQANQLILQKAQVFTEQMKQIDKDLVIDSAAAAGKFGNGFISQFDRVQSAAKNLSASLNSAVAASIVNSINTMVTSVKSGANALGNFFKGMLGVIGSFAQQIGAVFISTGIAIEATKTLSGFAAIAAGAGLVAVGAIISAFAGGTSDTPAAQPSTGGGISSSPGTPYSSLSSAPTQSAPNVTLVVQGSILDSQDTGHRLMTLLANSFQGTGAQLPSGIVMA